MSNNTKITFENLSSAMAEKSATLISPKPTAETINLLITQYASYDTAESYLASLAKVRAHPHFEWYCNSVRNDYADASNFDAAKCEEILIREVVNNPSYYCYKIPHDNSSPRISLYESAARSLDMKKSIADDFELSRKKAEVLNHENKLLADMQIVEREKWILWKDIKSDPLYDSQNNLYPLSGSLDHPLLVVSPINGDLYLQAKVGADAITAEDGTRVIYATFYLTDGKTSTPEFFTVEDLVSYCNVMRKAKTVQKAVSYGFGLSEIEGVTYQPSSGTVQGLYALVGESGFQSGPASNIGYASHIKSIHLPTDLTPQGWSNFIAEQNMKRDLPVRLEYVSVTLGGSVELPKPTSKEK